MERIIDAYLDLLKNCLLDNIYKNQYIIDDNFNKIRKATNEEIIEGNYWPERAHTMIGTKRLDNIRYCIEKCLEENIPGDFIETGVWRGGATIFMKGILNAYGITDRKVYVADSFEGLPPPEPDKYPKDVGDLHHTMNFIRVSQNEVMDNFKAYNLLDSNVIFIKGFFENSLKDAQIDTLAVLRLDGDMYSSTIQVLDQMYDKVAIGGFIIVDDYALSGAYTATNDFRASKNITDPLIPIGEIHGVYWRKSK